LKARALHKKGVLPGKGHSSGKTRTRRTPKQGETKRNPTSLPGSLLLLFLSRTTSRRETLGTRLGESLVVE